MRTDPMGKFCHPEKRSVVGQCEGVCRSIAFVRDDALYGKSKTPSEETLTGFWCPGQESNLHASRHTHLKRARLPIPPPGHKSSSIHLKERKTRLELATLTLARLCSTN